ncbi:MAG: PQQ-dependent sugar dehydrogenase [Bacteroidia bacterium]
MNSSEKYILSQVKIYLAATFFFLLVSGSACGQKKKVETEQGEVAVREIAQNLEHPWGMAFLPDGRLLVTERSGQLRILSNDTTLSDPLQGVPEVFAKGQGGLLDVALDPDFETNSLVYLSYAEPGPDNTASTALGRGRLEGNSIRDFSVIFRQEPKVDGSNHFGSRIVFFKGKIFLTLAERFKFDPAQDLSNHLGAIVRINRDGSIPPDNPFADQNDAEDAIWTYGHRNIQAAAIDPNTGNFWVAEMGPQDGDELNLITAGNNYGWPIVSWGENYDGSDIPDPPTRPEFTDAVVKWTPVISPSGMEFYTGDIFPEWQGKMLIGGLSSKALVVVTVNGEQAKESDRLDLGARIRNVKQAPDGSVYLLTDQNNGKILRLTK